jgi:hypothetical protein
MITGSKSSFWKKPTTRLGWWAVWLMAAFVVMFIINSTVFVPSSQIVSDAGWRHSWLPFYGVLMALCGLAGSGFGLIALLRKHERSWLVWLTLLPGVFMLFLLLGEVLIPH